MKMCTCSASIDAPSCAPFLVLQKTRDGFAMLCCLIISGKPVRDYYSPPKVCEDQETGPHLWLTYLNKVLCWRAVAYRAGSFVVSAKKEKHELVSM